MKIGFLGGTFDPPHRGHIAAASEAAKRLGLDILLLIPTGEPPHKTLPVDTAGTVHRMEMTRLAAEDISIPNVSVQVTDMEIRRGGKSYTADTTEELQKEYPGSELWLICGGDMFESLPKWYRSGWLAENLNFAVFSRTDKNSHDETDLGKLALEYSQKLHINALFIETEPTVISSTELRSLLKKGRGGEFLPLRVYEYILKNRLYGVRPEPDTLWEIVRPWIGEKRLPHILGCRAEAVRLAVRWGADIHDAENAAILHDITKKIDVNGQLLLCGKYDITIDNLDTAYESLLHAETGAAIAYKLFAISEEVRDAIRWHTTGRAGMSLLEKIIYLADTIEPTRNFNGVDELRKTAYKDLDGALIKSFGMSLDYLRKRGIKPHGSTAEAYHYLRHK